MLSIDLPDRFELEVREERKRQQSVHGTQDHEPFKYFCILAEECGEVGKAINDAYDWKLENFNSLEHAKLELVQTAAVAKAMYEAIERLENRV